MKSRKREEESRRSAAQALLDLTSDLNIPVEDLELENTTEADVERTFETSNSVCTQTDLSMDHISAMELELQNLRDETRDIMADKSRQFLQKSSFENNDEKVRVFTGLPSFTVLMIFYDDVKVCLKDIPTMMCFQQFLLACMRLRLNLTVQFLGYMFGVSTSTVSRVFMNVINIMNVRLVPLMVSWPEREQLRKTLPMTFRQTFKHCVCIIDCFEVFIEQPRDLKARAQTYSSYKSHNTMKYLIAIAPQGVITFISKGWGGRTSDVHITGNSEFLQNLLPGDLVLADRGFDVEDQVGLYCAKLEIPAFTSGKKQLASVDLEKTRGLAAVRIHVERVIGVARQKYTMLQGTIPITLLQNDPEVNLTTLDKIVRVACAMVNGSESVVPFD